MVSESRMITVDGLNIRYLNVEGPGTPVVFLHGGGTDSASLSWSPSLAALTGMRRLIAPDLPGYGESDKSSVPYSLAFYADFLAAFLDKLGLEKVSLAGISMGGGIALGFTLKYPERVDRLVLVDSYGLADKAPMHKLSYLFIRIPFINEWTWSLISRSRSMTASSLKGIFFHPERIPEDLVDEVFAELKRPGTGRAFIAFQKYEMGWHGLRTVYMDRLSEIQATTLIIHGSKDTLVPLEASRQAQSRIPNAQLSVMEECGHWPQREDPETFNRVLRGFLDA